MTDDDDLVEGMKRQLFDSVLDKGYAIQFVEADPSSVLHLGQPYAYTVGRSLVERPEFLVTGLPLALVEPLLTGLVGLDDTHAPGHAAFPPASSLHGLFPTIDIGHTQLTVKLIRADASPLLGALSMFGIRGVDAIQALWPREGRYPDENDRWPDQPIHPYGRTPLARRDPYRED